MPLKLTVLGSNSAIPAFGRNPSGQVLETDNSAYLIDCGEGTQMKLDEFKIKKSKILVIFISHLHGDHIFGLPGLITSYCLGGRTKKLQIFGPKGIEEFILTTLKLSYSYVNFDLVINEINTEIASEIYSDHNVMVEAVPLKHRVPTMGFIFKENPRRPKLDKTLIEKYELSKEQIVKILGGEDIGIDENWFLAPRMPRSYAYISDTSYFPEILPQLNGIQVLYHEATYDEDKRNLAEERFHSTSVDAARIAEGCSCTKLLLGHFSSRYHSTEPLAESAKTIFPNTECVHDGFVLEL
ncbi:MAG: ribonuclease Z [Saprospiraceae bacterium]|nr:ribonuclease Z [Saprospiraceae bacterium]